MVSIAIPRKWWKCYYRRRALCLFVFSYATGTSPSSLQVASSVLSAVWHSVEPGIPNEQEAIKVSAGSTPLDCSIHTVLSVSAGNSLGTERRPQGNATSPPSHWSPSSGR